MSMKLENIKIGQQIGTIFGIGVVNKYNPNYTVGKITEPRWFIVGKDFGGWLNINDIK